MLEPLSFETLCSATVPLRGTFRIESAGGDIDFGRLECIDHEITICDSTLGTLRFDGFRGHVALDDCHIKKIVLEEDVDAPGHRGAPFQVVNCAVDSVSIHARIDDPLMMVKSKFTGITDLSNSVFDVVDMSESNLDYTRFIGSRVGKLKLDTCRFVKLFDMNGTVAGALSLRRAIVLETFILPEIHDPEFGSILDFTDLSINGNVSLVMPIGQAFENRFIRSFSENSNSSGLMALRQVFEINRRYSAADTTYIYQKRKECEESRRGDSDAVLTPVQRWTTMFSYYLGGNGMRPSYTFVWLLVTVFLFALVMTVAGVENPHHITGDTFIDSLYLSVSSLFLGGSLDIKGIGTEGYFICLVEGMIGLFMMLHFTVILTRKIIR